MDGPTTSPPLTASNETSHWAASRETGYWEWLGLWLWWISFLARLLLPKLQRRRHFRILSIFNECSATKASASSNLNTPSVHPRARVQEAPTALAKLRVFSKDQASSSPVMKPAAKASPAPDSSTDLTW